MNVHKVLLGFLENFRRLVGGAVSGEVRYADFAADLSYEFSV